MTTPTVVLVTCSGRDAPGITSELTGVLASCDATLLDIGQAVLHGWLSLSLLFEAPNAATALTRLSEKAQQMGMKIESQNLDSRDLKNGPLAGKAYRYALTLMGAAISAQHLHEVTKLLARHRINIDVIERLSEGAFSCVEILVSSTAQVDRLAVKHELLALARS
jgi:phosphoserine phosphatase